MSPTALCVALQIALANCTTDTAFEAAAKSGRWHGSVAIGPGHWERQILDQTQLGARCYFWRYEESRTEPDGMHYMGGDSYICLDEGKQEVPTS